MRKLRANVAGFDARWWMRQLVGDALAVQPSEGTEENAGTTGRSMSV